MSTEELMNRRLAHVGALMTTAAACLATEALAGTVQDFDGGARTPYAEGQHIPACGECPDLMPGCGACPELLPGGCMGVG